MSYTVNPQAIRSAAKTRGISIVEFAKLAGIDHTSLYKILRTGKATELQRNRLSKIFETRPTPTDEVPPAAETETRARTQRSNMVPSGFLVPAVQRLGISQTELSKLTGVTTVTIQRFLRTGFCPLWFRSAVNGLMAEKVVEAPKANGHAKHQGYRMTLTFDPAYLNDVLAAMPRDVEFTLTMKE